MSRENYEWPSGIGAVASQQNIIDTENQCAFLIKKLDLNNLFHPTKEHR
jgi:hypothetical protein